jgi:hypothetical protein
MRTTQINYLRASVILPVALPAFGFGAAAVLSIFGTSLPHRVELFIEYSFGAMLLFGPLYFATTLVLLFTVRNRGLASHVAMALVAPVALASVLELLTVLVAGRSAGKGANLVKLTLLIGYVYVSLALAGLWLGTWFGCLVKPGQTDSESYKT